MLGLTFQDAGTTDVVTKLNLADLLLRNRIDRPNISQASDPVPGASMSQNDTHSKVLPDSDATNLLSINKPVGTLTVLPDGRLMFSDRDMNLTLVRREEECSRKR